MDGILIIDKPAGMTSFDVIAKLRRKYHQKKFGHAGTLDPMASGVLVVMAGRACKLLPFLADTDKEYVAQIALGQSFDTDDVTGSCLDTKAINSDFDFDQVLQSFVGHQHQLVPKASAKKVDGKKLYDYLRAGKEVPEVYADVDIYAMEAVDPKKLTFKVACSSGTYVRSLCRDFGSKTDNLAAMKSLVRTKANGFTLDQAESVDADTHTVWPMDSILDFERIQAEDVNAITNGKKQAFNTNAPRVLVMDGSEPLAIYDRQEDGQYKCARGLWA